MQRWIFLLVCLGVCFAVAGLSGRWTAEEIPGWYAGLRKPAINPPDWIFAPVWTALYALMAVAAWRVLLAESSAARTAGLALFLVQLALNFAWSWIFFRQHAIGAAFAEVVGLWAAIGITALLFARVDGAAAWMLVPYLAWVSFASVLNFLLWRLNHLR